MKQFYFLFLISLFSTFSVKAQQAAEGYYDYGECTSFEGYFWDEIVDNQILLRWDEPRPDEIICYQILGYNANGESPILAKLPGNETSYKTLESYPQRYMFQREGNPFCLMAFYASGEIAMSEYLYISVDPPRGINNFLYSYSMDGNYVKIDWETQGMRPMYYEIFRDGSHVRDIDGNESYYEDFEVGNHSSHTYSFRTFYEDGEELWLEDVLTVIPYDIEKIPYNFIYERQDDKMIFQWESHHEEFGFNVGFQIKCNKEIISDIDHTYYPETEIPLSEIMPSISQIRVDEMLYTGRLCRFSLYAKYWEEDIVIKAENDLFYSKIYRLPAFFGYRTNGQTMYLDWWYDSDEGILPSYYQIMENGNIIDYIEGDKTSYSIGMDTEKCYSYRVFAVYEDEIVLIAGYTDEFFMPAPVLVHIRPTNFAYTLEDNNVKLTWHLPPYTPSDLPPSQFKIQRNGENIATISGNTLTYTDQELEPGTYTYRLFAHYNTGDVLEAKNTITLIIDELIYAEPKYLSYDMDSMNVVLFWDLWGGDIEPSSYKIERNGNFIANVSSGAFTYYDITAGPGTHYYRLFVYYGDNTMKVIPEDSLEVIIPEFWEPVITGDNLVFSQHIVFDVEPVFQLSYTSDDNRVNLTWEMLEGNNVVNHYKIERNGNFLFQVDGNTLSFVDAGLEFGTYEYTVKAYYTNDSFLNHIARIVGRIVLTLFNCE